MSKKKKSKDEDPWKRGFDFALDHVKKFGSWGKEKSGKVSQLAKHQVKKGLLNRELNTLYQELGELTFQLLNEGKIEHENLNRTYERIQGVNKSIQEENDTIEAIKRGISSSGEEP